jgi:hypothetical protein
MICSKIKFFVLFFIVILSGCANTMEFTKNIKSEDFLFDENEFQALNIDPKKIESYSKKIGENKTGFIKPDESKERADFVEKYPVAIPDDKAYENLLGFTYNNKVGQVLRLSADLDKRTSGFVVDDKGIQLSVSNMMVFESNAVVSGAVSGGSSQAIASGVSSKSLINPTQGAGANIGAGLVAGLLAGFIHQMQADAAIAGIVSKNNFGARMEEATISAVMPTAVKIDKFGIPSNKSNVIIAPGLVKSIYVVTGKKNLQFKNQVFLISTIAVYRGVEYEKLFPATKGWDFSITNLNMIEVNSDVAGEERFKNFRNEISLKKIKL